MSDRPWFVVSLFFAAITTIVDSAWTDTIKSADFSLLDPAANYLAVTSFKFNGPKDNPSPWVEYMLGKESVNVAHDGRKTNSENLPPSPPVYLQGCSFEALGFIPRTNGQEKQLELDLGIRRKKKRMRIKSGQTWLIDTNKHTKAMPGYPFLNSSLIQLIGSAENEFAVTAQCYYRFEERNPDPRKNPVEKYVLVDYAFFYCPITQDQCSTFMKTLAKPEHVSKGTFRATLSMNLGSGFHMYDNPAAFDVAIIDKYRTLENKKQKKSDSSSWLTPQKGRNAKKQSALMEKKMGVCIVTPYHPADEVLSTVNTAMLMESIRYYSELGFHVSLYDNGGVDGPALHDPNHPYAKGRDIDLRRYQNFRYFDYTMVGLMKMDPTRALSGGNKMDINYDGFMSREVKYSDDDKYMTNSHCRFEFNALHGIGEVLVVDSDEFVYCRSPNVSATPSLDYQKISIRQAIYKRDAQQVMFGQHTPSNKTLGKYVSTRDCLYQKAINGESLFECYTSYRVPIRIHSIKSFHRGLVCPITSYHQACALEDNDVFTAKRIACTCKTFGYRLDSRCAVIHFQHNSYMSQFWKGEVSEMKKKKYWFPWHVKRSGLLEASQSELTVMMENFIDAKRLKQLEEKA